MMTCELCSHHMEESEAEVLQIESLVELKDGSETLIVDHYWACPDCVWLEEMNKKKSEKDPDTPKN